MLRVLLLSLCLVNSAYSAEKKQKNAYEEKKGNIDVGVSKTSSMNRKDKRVAISVGAGFEAVTATFSATLGYIIDENLIIDLRFSRGEDESNNLSANRKEFHSSSFGVKFFTSDFFYIRPAFEKFEVVDSNEGIGIEGNGFSFTVGNQWQYRNLTIGVDWVGVKHIINAAEITGSDDDARTHFSVAGFYVGTTF